MEKTMEVPYKTKNRVAIWSRNPTPGHTPRQNYNSKRYMYPYVHNSTIHNSQDVETLKSIVYPLLSIPGMDKEECGTFIQWNTTQP